MFDCTVTGKSVFGLFNFVVSQIIGVTKTRLSICRCCNVKYIYISLLRLSLLINREMVILVHHYLKWSLGSTINRNTDSLHSASWSKVHFVHFESVENTFTSQLLSKTPLKPVNYPIPKVRGYI